MEPPELAPDSAQPERQPFTTAPPKPQKIAIGTVITLIKLGTEIGIPFTTNLISQVKGSGGDKVAAVLLAMKEAELARRGPDDEVQSALADESVSVSVKYLVKNLVEQVADARATMKLCAEILGDRK